MIQGFFEVVKNRTNGCNTDSGRRTHAPFFWHHGIHLTTNLSALLPQVLQTGKHSHGQGILLIESPRLLGRKYLTSHFDIVERQSQGWIAIDHRMLSHKNNLAMCPADTLLFRHTFSLFLPSIFYILIYFWKKSDFFLF